MRWMVSIVCGLMWMLASAVAQDSTSFETKIANLEAKSGFFDLYVDEQAGKLLAALPAPDAQGVSLRFIYANGLTAGLGSNPIGLDRGAGSQGVIVRFRRFGDKLIAEQENLAYRATADRALEQLAVAQSFATSFLWSTDILAEGPDGQLLIDLSSFLVRDQFGIADDLRHGADSGTYSLAMDRSFPETRRALVFPDNVELDAILTFTSSRPNAETRATAPDARAVTLMLHHSFVRLPDDDYTPRKFDQRTANIGMGYYDYSAPLDAPIVTRFSRRFRLERVDADAASGPVKDPIVFYVDSGAPEQIRNALIEGASWWAEGFEAAGFEDAYRVEVLPEGAHPLDVRYNVINWVHRQTRGWSYGGSVSDPRTGEILKANVILGSQRVRQDRMIFEGLAGAGATGSGRADDPIEISLARIRQLSAHEVGHTLGFAHNFAASANDRASVMDYPAPYIRPTETGGLDFSEAYAVGLGAWDVFTVKWLYSQFPETDDNDAALNALVEAAYASGLRFVADRHGRSLGSAHPYASVWDNGSDAIATLDETMAVRRIALNGFGRDRLAQGRASSDLNAVIVPIYLYHRYQVAAAAKYLGGLDFSYGVNGDGSALATPVGPAEQRRALNSLLATLDPAELDLQDTVLNALTPGDVGYAGPRDAGEVFPNRTGPVFDLMMAADTAAALTLSAIFHPARMERLAAYAQRSEDVLSINEVLDTTTDTVFERAEDARLKPLGRTIQARYVSTLIDLARNNDSSLAVSAEVERELGDIRSRITRRRAARGTAETAHFAALAAQIDRHFERPEIRTPPRPQTPQGSPIGAGGFAESCWHCADD